MAKLKVTKCNGEGQGSCRRCTENGIWNRNWMELLSNIEGMSGCYCSDCVREIQKEYDESIKREENVRA